VGPVQRRGCDCDPCRRVLSESSVWFLR
jgi:hypothetical protein